MELFLAEFQELLKSFNEKDPLIPALITSEASKN
jgi:hypothetical protein